MGMDTIRSSGMLRVPQIRLGYTESGGAGICKRGNTRELERKVAPVQSPRTRVWGAPGDMLSLNIPTHVLEKRASPDL